jgi:hypothetical protein
MPQRVFLFVVVLILIFTGEIFSQRKSAFSAYNAPYSSSISQLAEKKISCFWKNSDSATKNTPPFQLLSSPLGSNFYTDHLSFFCKKELQIEKLTSIPFRFRLGSLDYVNYLEQKPNYKKPQ